MHKSFTILMLSGLLCLAGVASAQDTMSEPVAPAKAPTADETAEMPQAQPAAEMQVSEPAMEDSEAASDPTQYSCNYQGLVRHIEIAYEKPGFAVPCSVVYRKETEEPGTVQTLWTASNQPGYCEDKTSQFVDKLEGLAWTCEDAEL
jgi:hypothetical protein